MARLQVTWTIRNSLGQVKGPFTTAMILKMIGEGQFDGSEEACEYPSGRWRLISHYPEFYEKLLQGISPVQEAESKEIDEDTIPPTQIQIQEKPISLAAPVEESVPLLRPNYTERKEEVIDLQNVKQIRKKQLITKSSNKAPFFILVIAIFLGLFSLIDESDQEEKSSDRIRLLAPGKSHQSLNTQQLREKLSKAVIAIESGNTSDYLEAQNLLVGIVEGAPSSLDARGLLCLVYKELWPYSWQDAKDLRTINDITRSTKLINITSPYGDICEIVRLVVTGHHKEARGVLEGALELNDKFPLLSVLFYFKGEFFADEKDYLNAVPYLDKAGQLWAGWIAPKIMMAEIYRRTGQNQAAGQLLNWVLKKNPKHKEAKVQYGLLEYRGHRQVDKSLALLTSSLSQNGLIPNSLEADGYLALAEIMVAKHDPKKALEFAQKGFDANRNNRELKQLLLRLGGSDKIDPKKRKNNELLFLGDQFGRQGDFLSAQAEYKAAFEADPKNGMAAMKAAKALWQLNQSYEAIEWLKKAIKAEPELVSAYVLQADYMTQRFDFVNAYQVLASALKMSPRNHEVYRGLALMEFRRNNLGYAITYGQKAMQLYDQDAETLVITSKANLALSRSIVAVKKKEIEQKDSAMRDALRYAAKAIEIDSSNVEAQINYANVASVANGIDFGISFLQEKIKRFSYTSDYKVALGDLYRTEDRFSQARDIYENVVEMDPKNKKALLGLGLSFKAMGMVDKSLKSFLKAAVVDPTDGEALFQAGILYLEANRMNEAIDQFKRVYRMNSNFPKANYYIGKALFLAGNFSEALAAASTEKKKNPGLADAYILSAEIYNAQKQYSECATEYSSAIKLKAQTSEVFVRAAQCYRQSGSLDVAENMLESAMAIESGFAEIYKEQGALFETRGDMRAAIQSYGKYLGLSPNAKDRASVENHLQALERGN